MADGTAEIKNNNDLSTLLGGLLSNPEMLSKISNLISVLGMPQSSDNSPQTTDNESTNSNINDNNESVLSNSEDISPTFQNSESNYILTKMPEILSKFSSSKDENSIATKEQIALLLAIKPYLSDRRKELIDTFVKMNRLGAIFKNLT